MIHSEKNKYAFQVWVSYVQGLSQTTIQGLSEFLIHQHGISHNSMSNQGNNFITKSRVYGYITYCTIKEQPTW